VKFQEGRYATAIRHCAKKQHPLPARSQFVEKSPWAWTSLRSEQSLLSTLRCSSVNALFGKIASFSARFDGMSKNKPYSYLSFAVVSTRMHLQNLHNEASGIAASPGAQRRQYEFVIAKSVRQAPLPPCL